ncbi:S66 peptidase family protein [Labilithrix luteola]|uniref:S66 peptidase family protein n=1 Tax=Labilithrix luteola TaxID=1391654 RepID=UPI0011BA8589|nr:LD-carboxypeptidase [Labilithrix luteola]
MVFRVPPPIRPGSVVAIVAPSSPVATFQELFRGLAWLRTRYTLRISGRILGRAGYLAGDDRDRADDLAHAMLDPTVDAIVCARGGYGAMRIVDALPWDDFERRPKWILGFSDVTALHAVANRRNIASIHGPNVTGLGRSISPAERLSVIGALEGLALHASWSGLDVINHGRAEGPLVGGNLALVAAMAGAGEFTVPDGAILVLEDVTERPYRIDRMLTTLRLGGHLSRAGGVVFGGFDQCEPGPDRVTVAQVLRELTQGLGVPVVAGAPFGHGSPNEAFVLGQNAVLEGSVLRFV